MCHGGALLEGCAQKVCIGSASERCAGKPTATPHSGRGRIAVRHADVPGAAKEPVGSLRTLGFPFIPVELDIPQSMAPVPPFASRPDLTLLPARKI